MSGPFIFGESNTAPPVSTVTVSAANARGISMTRRAFATLSTQTFHGRGNGRFSLMDGRGPRVGAAKGTIDATFRMGTGADSVVLIQSSYSSTTAPLITIGVNSSGQAVGSIQDISGTTVAAWAATSLSTVTATSTINMQVAWDSSTPIDGSYHVWVVINGALMPQADFTTPPATSWSPFQGFYLTTGMFCETGFDGEMLFTQASALAPVLAPRVFRNVEVAPASLQLPLPMPQLSGVLTPAVSFTSTITLPSIQLSGSLTPTIGTLTGTLTLPSIQLSGTLTVTANKVSAWLQLSAGTTVTGDYSSVPDAFASNPAVQTTAAQRPTATTSANSLPTVTFVGADPNQLSWPKSANNSSTSKWGFACWIKMTTYPAQAYLFDFGGATSSYDNERVNLFFNSSRTIFFEVFGQDTAGYNGRIGQASFQSPVAGTWFWLRLQFDGTQATEALRIKIFINEVLATMTYVNNGSGGNPVLLRTNASNIPGIIGNFTNTADTSLALNGVIGPNIFIFSDSPTAAEAAVLMAFQQPT